MDAADDGVSLHPAAVLVGWLTLLVSLSALLQGWLRFSSQAGLLIALVIILFATMNCERQFITLMRRARWLLLSMACLGIWTTPGLSIAWLPGATYEGVRVTGYQFVQLVMTFAMVALLLGYQSIENLLLGLHTLIVPMECLGVEANLTSLRLALTLTQVDTASVHSEYQQGRILPATQSIFVLPDRRFSAKDFSLFAIVGIFAITALVYD
jgi:hypothetical protein